MQNPLVRPALTPELLAGVQAKADDIMSTARSVWGHGLLKMEAGGDGGDGGGQGSGGGGDGGSGGGSGDGSGSGDGTGDGDDALGDKGKQAIDRMKAERDAEKRRAKAAETELEKLRNASKTEQEKAVDAARKEGATEAVKQANTRIVRAEAKSLAAAAKFRDPGDVIAQLGTQLADITVDEDGEVDEKTLKGLVDGLAKSKPYLIDNGSSAATASDAGIGTTGSTKVTDPGPGRPRLHAAIEAASKK